jgi:integrase
VKRRSKGEGSIYHRADGLWVAQVPLVDGKRKYKYAKTQKEAREWLQKEQRAISDGLVVVDEKILFGDFLDRWFEDIAKPSLRPSTIVVHESVIRLHIKPEIGDLRLTQITPAILQNLYSRKLKSGLSKRTVKYIHTVIHRTLDQALKWSLVARNVADAVDAPKPDKKSIQPLTMTQVAKLFDTLKDDRLLPFYVTAVGCGLRRGELLALTWDCIDWDRGIIQVNKSLQALTGQGLVVGEPKSESSRRPVAMPEFVQKTLADSLVNRTIVSEYVFCTSKGTPFGPRNIVRHFKSTLKKAGLPDSIRLHDLRHTFVSLMLSQNVPPKDVQVIAGHADFSTTMNIYGHLMPGSQKEAAKKLDKLFDSFTANDTA